MHAAFGINTADTTAPVVRAFLAYDTAATGQALVATFDRLTTQFERDVLFDARVWRIDLVGTEECYAQALADGVSANLIVVAFAEPRRIPETFLNWLEDCAMHKGADGAALAAVPVGEAATAGGSGVITVLRRIAQRDGLEFVCNEGVLAAARWSEVRLGSHELDSDSHPLPEHGQGRFVPLAEWGINE